MMISMRTNDHPCPGLILALDKKSAAIAANIRNAYLRGDDRRPAITRFIMLTLSDRPKSSTEAKDDGSAQTQTRQGFHIEEIPNNFDELMVTKTGENEIAAFLDSTVDLRDELKIYLQAVLDQANYPTLQKRPQLNVFLLANLWEDSAAATLLPMMILLRQLLNDLQEVYVQLLMDVSQFAEEQHTTFQLARVPASIPEFRSAA